MFGQAQSETDGIGMDQQHFNCKYESNMRSRFEKTVAGLLVNTALHSRYDTDVRRHASAFTRAVRAIQGK